jgi:hypothetical protein
MATSVPSPTFSSNGFVAPSSAAILAGVQADLNLAFGGNLNPSLTTPQGQLATSFASIIGNVDSLFTYYANQVDPALASGRMQDAIARIYFLYRLPSQPTTLQILCTGAQGVPIPIGATIVDTANNLYTCTGSGAIGISGTVTLSFACTVPGPTVVPGTNAVSIYQAIPGWDSVTVVSGVIGRATETRAQFETRRQQSVALNSIGSLPSVLGAVLNVTGVLDAYVTENSTNGTLTLGGVTLNPNSLYVAAVGGSATAVAQAIWSKKAPGCGYTGTTTVTVFDSNSGYSPPLPSYTVSFQIPSTLAILFSVNIVTGPLVPANAVSLIQVALATAFTGADGGPRARIGSVLLATRYLGVIQALGSWAQIRSLQLGSNNSASAIAIGRISGTTLTATSLTSGSLGVGQTLSDGSGYISIGTQITALGTGAGGSGTYTVSNSQTVGGTCTATGSGTLLTVTALTGIIQAGNIIAGAGIPIGTTILSQSSGSVGGTGVYVTSQATTVSGAVTVGQLFTTAVASLTLVAVNINQEPVYNAANVSVTVT